MRYLEKEVKRLQDGAFDPRAPEGSVLLSQRALRFVMLAAISEAHELTDVELDAIAKSAIEREKTVAT